MWTGEDLSEQRAQPSHCPGWEKVQRPVCLEQRPHLLTLPFFTLKIISAFQTKWTACYNSNITADSTSCLNSLRFLWLSRYGLSTVNPETGSLGLPLPNRSPALCARPCSDCSSPPLDIQTAIYSATLSFALCDTKSLYKNALLSVFSTKGERLAGCHWLFYCWTE